MAEPKIARTVAEAQVGDLLWVRTDRWRKCDWLLWPVRKVGRIYVYVGDIAAEHTWARIDRERPYDANLGIMGWQQREAQHYHLQSDEMARRIRAADLETLRTVAFALGMDGSPDFSVISPEQAASPSPHPDPLTKAGGPSDA